MLTPVVVPSWPSSWVAMTPPSLCLPVPGEHESNRNTRPGGILDVDPRPIKQRSLTHRRSRSRILSALRPSVVLGRRPGGRLLQRPAHLCQRQL